MLTLITGVPGAGKTLRAVQLIKDKLSKQKVQQDDERPFKVYSNIDGLRVPGVLPAPDDWRDCEAPALWVIDEAQYMFPATGARGLDANPIIAEMATHRHTGIDLMLITQHPGLISSHVRKFVGRHEHLDRRFGSSIVTLYVNDGLMNVDSGLQKNEHEVWTHPKDLYDSYKSASLHIKNTRIPKGLRNLMLGLAGLVLFVGFMFYNSVGFLTGTRNAEASPTPQPTQQLNTAAAVQAPPEALTGSADKPLRMLAGCIANAYQCMCYSTEGHVVDMDTRQCLDTLDKPLPFPLKIEKS